MAFDVHRVPGASVYTDFRCSGWQGQEEQPLDDVAQAASASSSAAATQAQNDRASFWMSSAGAAMQPAKRRNLVLYMMGNGFSQPKVRYVPPGAAPAPAPPPAYVPAPAAAYVPVPVPAAPAYVPAPAPAPSRGTGRGAYVPAAVPAPGRGAVRFPVVAPRPAVRLSAPAPVFVRQAVGSGAGQFCFESVMCVICRALLEMCTLTEQVPSRTLNT